MTRALVVIFFAVLAAMSTGEPARADDLMSATHGAPTSAQVQSVLKIIVANAPTDFAALLQPKNAAQRELGRSLNKTCPLCIFDRSTPPNFPDWRIGVNFNIKQDADSADQTKALVSGLVETALGPSFTYQGDKRIVPDAGWVTYEMRWSGPQRVTVVGSYTTTDQPDQYGISIDVWHAVHQSY